MDSVITDEARARVLSSLKEAEALLAATPKAVVSRAPEAMKAEALVVAMLRDDYVPTSLFLAWASAKSFRRWRDDEKLKLDVVFRHKRLCVRPSAFFALWNKLPAERKRITSLSSAGHKAGTVDANRGGCARQIPRPANASRG